MLVWIQKEESDTQIRGEDLLRKEIEMQNKNETQSNRASTPAESIKNIKNNVQGTLDQIKARDEYQQELAN